MSDHDLRLGDAEREQAATELAEHYAQGRLTAEEHSERLDRVWAARTRGELVPVFRDLPRPGRTPYGVPPAGRWATPVAPWRRGIPGPVLGVLAVLLVVTVVSHLPFILLGLLVWFLLASRHRRRRDHAHPGRG